MRRVTKANKITAEKKEAVISDFHKELNEKEKHTDFYCQPKITKEKKGKRQVSINQDPNYKRSATVMLTCSNHGRKKGCIYYFQQSSNKKK